MVTVINRLGWVSRWKPVEQRGSFKAHARTSCYEREPEYEKLGPDEERGVKEKPRIAGYRMKRSVEERRKENLRPSVRSSVGARISHLHRNKLSGTMGSFVHSEHCKHGATVFPWTNGKALQYALLTLSTRGPAIIERPRLSFVYHTIISYLVTLHGGCRHRLASLKDTHKPLYTRSTRIYFPRLSSTIFSLCLLLSFLFILFSRFVLSVWSRELLREPCWKNRSFLYTASRSSRL